MRRLVSDLRNPKRRWIALFHEFVLFVFGGVIYNLVELLWRSRTAFSMFIVGGLCFLLVGALNEFFPWEMPLCSQMFLSMVGVTAIELVSGIYLNIIGNFNVWDYSHMPYNLCGQICLIFSVAWFFLSLVAIFIDDWLREIFFDEKRPKYTWFVTKPPEENIDE